MLGLDKEHFDLDLDSTVAQSRSCERYVAQRKFGNVDKQKTPGRKSFGGSSVERSETSRGKEANRLETGARAYKQMEFYDQCQRSV